MHLKTDYKMVINSVFECNLFKKGFKLKYNQNNKLIYLTIHSCLVCIFINQVIATDEYYINTFTEEDKLVYLLAEVIG